MEEDAKPAAKTVENQDIDRVADRQEERRRIGNECAGKHKRENGQAQPRDQGINCRREDQGSRIIREKRGRERSGEENAEE